MSRQGALFYRYVILGSHSNLKNNLEYQKVTR